MQKCEYFLIPGIGVSNNKFFKVTTEEKLSLRLKNKFNNNDFLLIYAAEFINRKNHQFILGIRPEGIRATIEKDDNLFEKKVLVSELLGSEYYLHFNFTENTKLVVKASADESYSINEKVYLEFIKDKITIFDPVTEKNIE